MAAPVVVVGPTASGKSDVAMAAARAVLGTEIVAVDAMQVYRGMDIGTAKPSAEDRAEVRHHCLDLVEPDVEFTVADYRRAFDEAAATIDGRPLLVAGTGLYLTAVIDRLDVPGRWPEVRAELEGEDAGRALAAPRRTRSGRGRAHRARQPAPRRAGPRGLSRERAAVQLVRAGRRVVSADGRGDDRPALAAASARGEDRASGSTTMVAAGLVDEVARLAAPGLSRTARQALGYKELLDHLDGRTSLDEAVAARSSLAPASSPSARSGGSVATPAYAGATSTATRCPRWRRP